MARSRARGSSSKKGISVSRLEKDLAADAAAPVYLLAGEDGFLRDRAMQVIASAVVGEDDSGMAIERVDASESPLPEILDVARTLPLFLPSADGPVRLVLVSDFDPGEVGDVDLLAAYLADPVPETCLVLVATGLDARRAASKLLLERAITVDCSSPSEERDVGRWIEQRAAAMELTIEDEARTYLLEMVGNNLQQLDQELEKLALLVGDRGNIEAQDAEALLGRSREHSVFELTDALVGGDADKALHLLNRLLDDGTAPAALLGMIAWIVRQMVLAQDLERRGCPERELLQQIKGRWDGRKAILARARRAGDDFEKLLVACADADIAVKVGRGLAGRGTLETLCRRICAA